MGEVDINGDSYPVQVGPREVAFVTQGECVGAHVATNQFDTALRGSAGTARFLACWDMDVFVPGGSVWRRV